MNLQRFHHFIAVAEEGSFTRAAERIGMRQPPLSQSIRRLEAEVGADLFVRTPFGATLTRSGAAFLAEAREALAAAERAIDLARAANRPGKPAVRLGIVSLALFELLPELVAAARDSELTLDVHYVSTNDQVVALANGTLDLGLLTPPFSAPRRMKVTPIAEEQLVAALPAALAGGGPSISLAALEPHLILFPRREGPTLHDAITDLFRTAGFPLTKRQEVPASMLATLGLVAAGAGASLVPAVVARNVSVNGLEFRQLDCAGPVPTWPIALAQMPLSAESPSARLLRAWGRPRRLA